MDMAALIGAGVSYLIHRGSGTRYTHSTRCYGVTGSHLPSLRISIARQMQHGQIVASGPHGELVASSDLYKDLVKFQLQTDDVVPPVDSTGSLQ